MSCLGRSREIGEAAAGFADILAGLQQILLPIPQHAIEDVISRAARATVH